MWSFTLFWIKLLIFKENFMSHFSILDHKVVILCIFYDHFPLSIYNSDTRLVTPALYLTLLQNRKGCTACVLMNYLYSPIFFWNYRVFNQDKHATPERYLCKSYKALLIMSILISQKIKVLIKIFLWISCELENSLRRWVSSNKMSVKWSSF